MLELSAKIAHAYELSPKTIAMWCDRGKLPCIVLSSGHRRIPAAAVAPYKARLSALKSLDESMAQVWADVSEDDVVQEMLERGRLGP